MELKLLLWLDSSPGEITKRSETIGIFSFLILVLLL